MEKPLLKRAILNTTVFGSCNPNTTISAGITNIDFDGEISTITNSHGHRLNVSMTQRRLIRYTLYLIRQATVTIPMSLMGFKGGRGVHGIPCAFNSDAGAQHKKSNALGNQHPTGSLLSGFSPTRATFHFVFSAWPGGTCLQQKTIGPVSQNHNERT